MNNTDSIVNGYAVAPSQLRSRSSERSEPMSAACLIGAGLWFRPGYSFDESAAGRGGSTGPGRGCCGRGRPDAYVRGLKCVNRQVFRPPADGANPRFGFCPTGTQPRLRPGAGRSGRRWRWSAVFDPNEKLVFDGMVNRLRADDPGFLRRLDRIGRPRRRLRMVLADSAVDGRAGVHRLRRVDRTDPGGGRGRVRLPAAGQARWHRRPGRLVVVVESASRRSLRRRHGGRIPARLLSGQRHFSPVSRS